MTTPQSPTPAASGMVTVPREIVANYARSTEIPRHRRICEEALAAQPAPGVGGDVDEVMTDLLDCQEAMRAASKLPSSTVERVKAWDDCATYCLAFVSDHLPKIKAALSTRPAESVAQGGEAVRDVMQAHQEAAERANFKRCGCDYCSALRATPTPATGSGGEVVFCRCVEGSREQVLCMDKRECRRVTAHSEHPAPAGGGAGDDPAMEAWPIDDMRCTGGKGDRP